VTGGSVIASVKKTSIYIEPEIDVALSRRAAEPVLAAWSAGEITTDEMIEQAQALAAGNDQEFPAHAA
jgi:hypothetical protein